MMKSDGSEYALGRDGVPSGIVRNRHSDRGSNNGGPGSGVDNTSQRSTHVIQQNYTTLTADQGSTTRMSANSRCSVRNQASQHIHQNNGPRSPILTAPPTN